jgi:tRNA-binding protein
MHLPTPRFNNDPLAHGRLDVDTSTAPTNTGSIHEDEDAAMTEPPEENNRPENTSASDDASVPDAPPPLRPLDLRVARITRARSHPNADRLLVLDIDLGDEERQIVAGIAAHYQPTDLDGLHIVVVANLLPARLRGEISQGMLLAAQNDDTLGLLLAPDADPGTRLTSTGPETTPSISIDDFAAHDLRATPDGVTVDGEPVRAARLMVDRGVSGKLR